jgi:hypothetical protein
VESIDIARRGRGSLAMGEHVQKGETASGPDEGEYGPAPFLIERQPLSVEVPEKVSVG